MPHQCTNCGRGFDDGSTEMLSGCPGCGGNKFQFQPGDTDEPVDASAEPPEPPDRPGSSSVAQTVGKTAATVRDLMSGGTSSEPSIGAEPPDPQESTEDVITEARENTAQASARTDVVSPDELPAAPQTDTEHRFQPVGKTEEDADAAPAQAASAEAEDDQTRERPDLKELREELNDQFESIKVLSPGQYELNLMELFDREEYIVALQEDGRYSIQVPENFRE